MKFNILNLTRQALPITLKDGSTSIPAKGKLENIEAGQLGTADVTRKKNKKMIKLVPVREQAERQKPFKREMPAPPTSKKVKKVVETAKPTPPPSGAADEALADTTKPSNGSRKKRSSKTD